VPDPDDSAVALPVLPADAPEPWAEPDPDELAFADPPVADELFELEADADPVPDPAPDEPALVFPVVSSDMLDPCVVDVDPAPDAVLPDVPLIPEPVDAVDP
jgi:hypothetical protein